MSQEWARHTKRDRANQTCPIISVRDCGLTDLGRCGVPVIDQADMTADLTTGLRHPTQSGLLEDKSPSCNQAALTSIIFAVFCAAALFGSITVST